MSQTVTIAIAPDGTKTITAASDSADHIEVGVVEHPDGGFSVTTDGATQASIATQLADIQTGVNALLAGQAAAVSTESADTVSVTSAIAAAATANAFGFQQVETQLDTANTALATDATQLAGLESDVAQLTTDVAQVVANTTHV